MSFYSRHARRIWNDLYRVMIPDLVTQNPLYLQKFGHFVSGNETLDRQRQNEYTTVMIPIIRIAEYYNDGIVVKVPSRDDMLRMHRNIEMYLDEWRVYLSTSINGDISENKALITGLENLSKLIYEKAQPKEVITQLFNKSSVGLVNPLQRLMEQKKEVVKPDYDSISNLLKARRKGSRF